MTDIKQKPVKAKKGSKLLRDMKRHKAVYLLLIPVVAFYVIFCYGPMYGSLIAFQNYKPALGFTGSKWVGFENFIDFFTAPDFFRLFRNTFLIGLYSLVFGFAPPIIFAILLNEVKSMTYRKIVQTFSYLPHFISTVILCSLIITFTSSTGPITHFVQMLGIDVGKAGLIANPDWFRGIYVVSGIWAGIGWGSIVYLAAISGVDVSLFESAYLDGANKFQMIWHITIPSILPTVITMLILNMGSILGVGWEKIFLLYTPLTYEKADVISTYVYRKGITDMNYSFSTAVGLFNSVINCFFIVTANRISRKLTETSLW